MKWQIELCVGKLDDPRHEVVEVEAPDILSAIRQVETSGYDAKQIIAATILD